MDIQRTNPAEYHARQAKLCDEAAAAYASELSICRDLPRREQLATKARHHKEQAAFHREMAEKLAG